MIYFEKMTETAIDRLAAAIGYPDKIPSGVSRTTFRVDDAEIVASVDSGRLVLSQDLTGDESLFPALAGYAAGRMLREDAVLSFGDGKVFLWQSAPADAPGAALARLFEEFADSCDWWRARVDAKRGGANGSASGPETMMIRP